MERIDKLVKNYLEQSTEYALMINGEWGSGKTHYYNYTLKKLVSETSNSYNQKFKPLYISLFGLNSLEEIQRLLFLEIHPFFKSKTAKISSAALKIIANGASNFFSFGGFETKDIENSLIDFNEDKFKDYVIFFDDIERRGDGLKDITLFIGFVNSLIENNGKVVLIAFQNEIDEFENLREKVIGNIIEFKPEIGQVYDDIIGAYSEKYTDYYEHLQYKKDLVIKNVEISGKTNYRILKFFLEHYRIVYEKYQVLIEFFPETLVVQINTSILVYCFMISAEYRIGKISKDSRKEFNNYLSSDSLLMLNLSKRETPSLGSQIIEKYFRTIPYNNYFSIFDFILGIDELKEDKLKSEIFKDFRISDKRRLPKFSLLEEFQQHEFLKFNESEFVVKYKQLLKFAFNGDFDSLLDYLLILEIVIVHQDIFPVNAQDLALRFEKVINKKYKFNPNDSIFDHFRSYYESNRSNSIFISFKDFCEQKSKTKRIENEKSKMKKQFLVFLEDKNQFFEIYSKGLNLTDSVFSTWNFNSFFKYFRSFSNEELYGFWNFLNDRYYERKIYQDEIAFFTQLVFKIEAMKISKDLKVKLWNLKMIKLFIKKHLPEDISF